MAAQSLRASPKPKVATALTVGVYTSSAAEEGAELMPSPASLAAGVLLTGVGIAMCEFPSSSASMDAEFRSGIAKVKCLRDGRFVRPGSHACRIRPSITPRKSAGAPKSPGHNGVAVGGEALELGVFHSCVGRVVLDSWSRLESMYLAFPTFSSRSVERGQSHYLGCSRQNLA